MDVASHLKVIVAMVVLVHLYFKIAETIRRQAHSSTVGYSMCLYNYEQHLCLKNHAEVEIRCMTLSLSMFIPEINLALAHINQYNLQVMSYLLIFV